MKVVGGSFGVTGSLRVDGSELVLDSAVQKRFSKDQIARVDSSSRKERSFSIVSFLVLAVVLGLLGFVVFAVLGAFLGLVLAVAGSFVSSTTLAAEVEFVDGTRVSVEGWHYELQKLIKLANS